MPRSAVAAPARKPIRLYFWPTPNGRKISIMLEECRLPYDVEAIDIRAGAQFAPKFLRVSPNNRIPAIVDPEGPGGKPVSVFESGAILQYLGRKTGRFYPQAERQRIAVEEWLFWQMGGLGPMAGQAHHFRRFAPRKIPYGIKRYTEETGRLYGVMNRRLRGRDYLAGRSYSIADMACWCWVASYRFQGQDLSDFPALKRWFARVGARPAVQRGYDLGSDWD